MPAYNGTQNAGEIEASWTLPKIAQQKLLDMQNANPIKTADFAFQQGKGYIQPNFDSSGKFGGYSQNNENYDKDYNINRARSPQLSPAPSGNATPPFAPPGGPSYGQGSPANQNSDQYPSQSNQGILQGIMDGGRGPSSYPENQLTGDKTSPYTAFMGANTVKAAADTAPTPGTPQPLYRDPKTSQQAAKHASDVLLAGANSKADETFLAGAPVRDPSGQLIQPVNQHDSFPNINMDVSGQSLAAPAPPANPDALGRDPADNGLKPSPYMLGRITDQLTNTPHDPIIPVKNLPPAIRNMLDPDNTYDGGVPTSLASHYLLGALRNQGMQTDPATIDAGQKVLSGEMSPAQAAAQLSLQSGGANLKKPQMDYLEKMAQLANANKKTDISQGELDLRKSQAQIQNAKGASEPYVKSLLRSTDNDITASHQLDMIDTMLNRNNTSGTAALIPLLIDKTMLAQRMTNYDAQQGLGLRGPGDALQQLVTRFYTGNMTPENKAFFKTMVQDIRNAHAANIKGMSERYGSAAKAQMIQAGVDPAKADSFWESATDPQSLYQKKVQEEELNKFSPNPQDAGQAPQASAPAAQQANSPAPPMPNPSKDQAGKFTDFMRQTTQAFKDVSSDPDLTPTERLTYKQSIKMKYKKITGIDWEQ